MTEEKLIEKINEFGRKEKEYHTSDVRLEDYAQFPTDENYMNSTYYNKDGLGYEEKKYLSVLAEKYNYGTVEELIDELYQNCDIKIVWNSGYYYKPRGVISFGYYRIEEVEEFLPDDLQEELEKHNLKAVQDGVNEYLDDNGQEICLYLCGGVSFELNIDDAIEYLEENKGE